MPDKEKVKYSIERCISHVPDACRDCAYDAGHPYNECVEMMLKDVLALLKKHDAVMPRVSSVEQRCGNCNKVIEMDGWKTCPWCGKPIDWEGWWRKNANGVMHDGRTD